ITLNSIPLNLGEISSMVISIKSASSCLRRRPSIITILSSFTIFKSLLTRLAEERPSTSWYGTNLKVTIFVYLASFNLYILVLRKLLGFLMFTVHLLCKGKELFVKLFHVLSIFC